MPGFYPIDRLLVQIEEDPIEGAKAAQKRYAAVRQANYECSVSAGALYRALKKSPKLTSAFYALPFWKSSEEKKAYQRNPKNLNKHCHQFIYGARDGSEGKRAEDHAAATQSYLDDEAKSLDELLHALKAGGFDGLKKNDVSRTARTQPKAVAAPPHKRSLPQSETSDVIVPLKRSAPSNSQPSANSEPRLTMKQVFKHLLVSMEADDLNKFLPDESEIGDEYRLDIRREADDAQGLAVWRANKIGRVHTAQ